MGSVLVRPSAIAVAVDEQGRWVDTGRWRDRGITHWHLRHEDWPIGDPQRLDHHRYTEAVLDAHAIAYNPHEALDWLLTRYRAALSAAAADSHAARAAGLVTTDDWREREEVSFYLLANGSIAGRGIAPSNGRIIDNFAHPMTAQRCRRHQQP